MAAATHKDGDSNPSKKGFSIIEGDTNTRENVLNIVEGDKKTSDKRFNLVKEERTKPGEHPNINNIPKEKNMDYSDMVFHCPFKSCRTGEYFSLLHRFIDVQHKYISPLYHVTISPFHQF